MLILIGLFCWMLYNFKEQDLRSSAVPKIAPNASKVGSYSGIPVVNPIDFFQWSTVVPRWEKISSKVCMIWRRLPKLAASCAKLETDDATFDTSHGMDDIFSPCYPALVILDTGCNMGDTFGPGCKMLDTFEMGCKFPYTPMHCYMSDILQLQHDHKLMSHSH